MVQNSQEPNQIDQKVHLGLILGYKSVRKAKNYQFGHFYIPNMDPWGKFGIILIEFFDQDTIPSLNHIVWM